MQTNENEAVDKPVDKPLDAGYRSRVIQHISQKLQVRPGSLKRDDIIQKWQNRGIRREHLSNVLGRMARRRLVPTDVLQYIENDPIVRDLGVPEMSEFSKAERIKLEADLKAQRLAIEAVGGLKRSQEEIKRLHSDPRVLAARDKALREIQEMSAA